MKLKGLKEMENENNKRDFISGDLCIIVNKPFVYNSYKEEGQYKVYYFLELLEEDNYKSLSGFVYTIHDFANNINLKVKNTYCNFWVFTEENYKKIKNILRRLLKNGKSK